MNALAKEFRNQALVVELDATDAGQRESAVKACHGGHRRGAWFARAYGYRPHALSVSSWIGHVDDSIVRPSRGRYRSPNKDITVGPVVERRHGHR